MNAATSEDEPMPRKMRFGGLSLDSEAWTALSCLCFPKPGAPDWINPNPNFPTPAVEQVRIQILYYCETCDRPFESAVTPVKCPHCGAPPGEQAVALTHKGYTARIFPFFVPE